jgi:hypothetical protein
MAGKGLSLNGWESIECSSLFVQFFPWYIYFSKFNAMMPCLFDFVCNHKASPYSFMYNGTGKPNLHWMWDHPQMMRLESWEYWLLWDLHWIHIQVVKWINLKEWTICLMLSYSHKRHKNWLGKWHGIGVKSKINVLGYPNPRNQYFFFSRFGDQVGVE